MPSLHSPMPLFSIIIAVYNDWAVLGPCVQSLEQQTDGPDFEVIVVDDGSVEEAPEAIRQWADRFPLSLVREPHTGIAAARNRGVQISSGSILLFIDADCRLRPDCLAALSAGIAASPTHSCFQLRIVGEGRGVVGKAEELRLLTLQHQLLQPDGRIRYLNTAGFAIRRSHVEIENGLFDSSTIRAEDTLLLANLIRRDELPFFVTNAIVRHEVALSLLQSFRKDIRSGLREGRTYDLIASKGIKIRMSHRERLSMLRSMWKASGQPSIGRSAWFALTARQSLQRITSVLYPLFRKQYDPQKANPACETQR